MDAALQCCDAMIDRNAIYTVGYGNRDIADFIALLMRYEIEYLIDTRSVPHSRFRPDFNCNALKLSIEDAGLHYVFMGDQLGGKVKDPACLRNGKVDFNLVREQSWFQQGIDRLEAAHQQANRVAVMCAELKPEQCHRFFLIAPALVQRHLPVIHIDEAGEAKAHNDIRRRMDGDQLSLL